MKNIVIIGGGFGGMSALMTLRRMSADIAITLIDRKPDFNFLPLLPDLIGRNIAPATVVFNLPIFCLKHGCAFLCDEVRSVDVNNNVVSTSKKNIPYDYLIIAAGSETNFYGNAQAEKFAYKLDDVADAERMIEALRSDAQETFIIVGGGYTGIEVATNIRRYFSERRQHKKIIIVERSSSLLGPLPEWMKNYVVRNAGVLDIEVMTDCTVAAIDDNNVVLSNGSTFTKAMLIWCAGVKANDFIPAPQATKDRQGRISVDPYLRLSERCFVVGDAAHFPAGDSCLRMAVQFSIIQGKVAAANIIRDSAGQPLQRYRPSDVGLIIPLANNRSCGVILGWAMKGVLPTLFHFIMCLYRLPGSANKKNLLKVLLLRRCAMKEWASVPLRWGVGIIFFLHGLQKAFGMFGGPGIEKLSQLISGLGFAPITLFTYLLAYTELLGGLFLLLGLCVRISSVFLSIVMLVAIVKVHLAKGFFLSNGGFEYPLMLLLACISLLISGAGKLSITKKL